MNANSITRFEVNNFKKFDHLVVENMGQVNLITGDNNVGKTTFLEALLVNENNLKWITYLHQTLCSRRIHIHPTEINTKEPKFPEENFLVHVLKKIEKKLVCKYKVFSGIEDEFAIEYKTIQNITEQEFAEHRKDKYNIANVKDWVVFYKNKKIDEIQWLYYDDKERNMHYDYWPIITFNASYSNDLPFYLEILASETKGLNYSDKRRILELLKIWIGDVVDYELKKFGRDQLIGIATKKDNNYRALTVFGDGIQKFFRYIVEILFAQKHGETRIMIDEIDTGIHYLRMKNEWKAIFQLAQETGIQVFATTHSMDCVRAFAEAGDENDSIKADLRLIEIEEYTKKDNNIAHSATTYNHESLKFKIKAGTNVRGGNVWQ